MSLHFTALVREKSEVIRGLDAALKLLADEKSWNKTRKDEMQRKLATTEDVLEVWDACISELTEEVKDQQSGAWSWARLNTLCAHRDGKLLKEKVAKEIADLVSYFDEEEEFGGEDAASAT